MKTFDLTGQRFGRLIALRFAYRKASKRMWECICDCGKSTFVSTDRLRRGTTKSCGCIHRERAEHMKLRHGHARIGKTSSAYMRWAEMLARCLRPKHKRFADYGGRRISVCERWHVFENFLQDMGDPPPGTVLDRRNNNEGYSPNNCRWATRIESARNCRSNAVIAHNGVTATMAEWAERLNLPYSTLQSRRQDGLVPPELFKPITPGYPRTPKKTTV